MERKPDLSRFIDMRIHPISWVKTNELIQDTKRKELMASKSEFRKTMELIWLWQDRLVDKRENDRYLVLSLGGELVIRRPNFKEEDTQWISINARTGQLYLIYTAPDSFLRTSYSTYSQIAIYEKIFDFIKQGEISAESVESAIEEHVRLSSIGLGQYTEEHIDFRGFYLQIAAKENPERYGHLI